MSVMQLAATFARVQRHAGLARYSAFLGQRSFATVDSSSPDSHDDFKPKLKANPPQDAHAQIENDIKSHDVFIYMKGDPEQPQCGFSRMACMVLDAYGVRYGSRNVLADPAIREGIKKFSNWPTIPQVYVEGEFIGGSDVLRSMHDTGDLEKLLGPIITRQEEEAKKTATSGGKAK